MVEFKITGEALWERMERAVEKVNERLRRTVQILEDARIPYAIVGGHAVRAWVAQVDEGALRTTKDVDVLLRCDDLPAMIEAMTRSGFFIVNRLAWTSSRIRLKDQRMESTSYSPGKW
jgi:hypothetical protein